MISKSGILVIAVFACSVTAAPPCTCARNYRPVCGSDGKTYANECLLVCAQQTKSDLSLVKEGPCNDKWPEPCICTMEYKPTCGVDGTTYSNPCDARCNNVEVSHPGECQSVLVAQPPCICNKQKKPVCGSDGKTYSNDCLLNCATVNNSRLSIVHSGPCEGTVGTEVHFVDNSGNVDQPECTCPDKRAVVCGSDGVSYDNDCWLNCATAHNSQLSIAHSGSCESDSVKVAEPAQNLCTCTRNLNPVCGSDGVTYNNECLLKCAGVTKDREGAC